MSEYAWILIVLYNKMHEGKGMFVNGIKIIVSTAKVSNLSSVAVAFVLVTRAHVINYKPMLYS